MHSHAVDSPVAIRGSLRGGGRSLETLLPTSVRKSSNCLSCSSDVLTLNPEHNGYEQGLEDA